MALLWRIWAAVVLINLVVLSIFVGIATLRYASINSALIGERLAVLGNRTAAPFAAAARIGLPVGAVRNAPAVLERARQTDDVIVAIHVFDAQGRVVRSTSASPPATIPKAATAARLVAGGRPWYRETDEGFLSGVEILGRDGATAGGILIVYPREGSVTRIWAMSAELALAGIAVLVLSAAAGALLLRIGLARQIAAFRDVERAVEEFEYRSWRTKIDPLSPSGSDVPADGIDALRELLRAAERRYLDAAQMLSDARSGQR